MSDQIKDKMPRRSSSSHESVEEAVFKYVGEGFSGVNEEEDEPRKENRIDNSNKSLTFKNGKETNMAPPGNHQSTGNTNGHENKENNNNNADTHSSENNRHNENTSDMTWYLKHDEDLNNTSYNPGESSVERQQPDREQDSINNNALALAAVVAAYQTEKLNSAKRKQNDDDFSNTNTTTHATAVAVSTSASSNHYTGGNFDHKRAYKKRKPNTNHHDNPDIEEENMVNKLHDSLKKDKSQIAVDPELATLDDPSSQNQLVNKAIAEADSISQQPDFQQYLNTEAEPEVNHSMRDGLDKNNGSRIHHQQEQHVAVDENTPHKDYNQLDKNSAEVTASDIAKAAAAAVAASLRDDNKKRNNLNKLEDDNFDADNELLENAANKASKIIGSASSTQTSGKAFDATEEAALDHFIEEYQRIKNFTRRETCERIWTNGRRKDDFWINICKVLPYRTRSSIYKHVRRRYHVFEQRGKWTPEEDHQLAELCEDKAGQWSVVGKVLGRMPEDCRDRWRNYIKCGENRASNKWSAEEEHMLKTVIAEMLEEAEDYEERKEHGLLDSDGDGVAQNRGARGKKINGKPSFKDIINWTIVSERMGGTRSRIQCRYKWNKLIRKQAVSKAEHIPKSERRWLVEKLRDLGFTEDSQVDWDELATLQGNKWTGLELKVCYEKMRTMVKAYKALSISDVSKALIDILLDDDILMDKE